MTVLSDIVNKCAAGTSIDTYKVIDCFDTDVFHTVMSNTARETVEHTQTPWIMITNRTNVPMVFTGDITDKKFLLQLVCDAWKFNGGDLSLAKGCGFPNGTAVQAALV